MKLVISRIFRYWSYIQTNLPAFPLNWVILMSFCGLMEEPRFPHESARLTKSAPARINLSFGDNRENVFGRSQSQEIGGVA